MLSCVARGWVTHTHTCVYCKLDCVVWLFCYCSFFFVLNSSVGWGKVSVYLFVRVFAKYKTAFIALQEINYKKTIYCLITYLVIFYKYFFFWTQICFIYGSVIFCVTSGVLSRGLARFIFCWTDKYTNVHKRGKLITIISITSESALLFWVGFPNEKKKTESAEGGLSCGQMTIAPWQLRFLTCDRKGDCFHRFNQYVVGCCDVGGVLKWIAEAVRLSSRWRQSHRSN